MAFVGMRHPAWAPIESYTPGTGIVYGEGVVLGKAVGATITLKRANAVLPADDGIAESDNSVVGGTLNVETDDVKNEVAARVWGQVIRKVGEHTAYTTTGDSAPYGGCAWVDVRKNEGVESYVVNHVHKVQLGRDTKNSATKGQQLTYQTTAQSGTMMPVQLDETLKDYYMDEIPVETLAEAIALVDSLLNVASADSQTTEAEGGETA